MKIFVVLEFLSDQGRADYLAVPLDQASFGLLGKITPAIAVIASG
jgi:hypothetical protein